MRIRFLILFMLLAGAASICSAQTFSNQQLREWEKHPHWIAMMEDSTANYFEVVAAFESFWKNREMPVEEDEVLGAERGEREDESFLKRLFRSRKKELRTERAMRSNYAFEVKKYKHWKLLTEPWVQEDGSILMPSEQMEIWRTVR